MRGFLRTLAIIAVAGVLSDAVIPCQPGAAAQAQQVTAAGEPQSLQIWQVCHCSCREDVQGHTPVGLQQPAVPSSSTALSADRPDLDSAAVAWAALPGAAQDRDPPPRRPI